MHVRITAKNLHANPVTLEHPKSTVILLPILTLIFNSQAHGEHYGGEKYGQTHEEWVENIGIKRWIFKVKMFWLESFLKVNVKLKTN